MKRNFNGAWKMLSLDESLRCLENGAQPLPSADDFACFIRKCRRSKDQAAVQRLHICMRNMGLEKQAFLGNHLVVMLVEVGRVHDAQRVFDGLDLCDEVSWDALIAGYTKSDKPQLALAIYQRMMRETSVRPNGHTFVSVLKACARSKNVEIGLEVHDKVAEMGLLEVDFFVGSNLVDMYIKCGELTRAHQVFDKLPIRNVVSWTILIAGYVDHGHSEEAIKCLDQMLLEGVLPDVVAIICSLRACGSMRNIDKGREIHGEIERQNLLARDLSLGNALVDMYSKCGALMLAQDVFDKLPSRDLVSWTALIAGYAEQGNGHKALQYLQQLRSQGHSPDAVTLICSLKACGSIKNLEIGFHIHTEIEIRGLCGTDVVVGNGLVDMYAKCDQLVAAQSVFDKLSSRNVVSWNALIEGYAEHGFGKKALKLFQQMQLQGVCADATTFTSSLKACRSTGAAMEKVQEIHAEVERQGLLEESLPIGNMLVDLYAIGGSLMKAQQVFDKLLKRDIFTWNALMEGYVEHGHSEEALECFEQMQFDGIDPDAVTYVCVLKACANIEGLGEGEEVHLEIERLGLLGRNPVIGNALMAMYAKCGFMAKAQHVFDRLPVQDVVSWNILISGHGEHGSGEEAIDCFEKMQQARVIPDAVSFICSLKACGDRGALEKGEEIHGEIERQGLLEREVLLGSSLVDMYAKCGSLSKASQVFDKILIQNAVPWNALMSGYAQLGESEGVFGTFERMLREGMKPNLITFVVVLSACSRAGLFSRSERYLEAMTKEYGIVPTSEHQATMVEVFCRAGEINKAIESIRKLPTPPSLEIWHSVLGACKHSGNVECGEQAFEHAVRINRNNAAAYALMSDIYASAEHGERLRSVR